MLGPMVAGGGSPASPLKMEPGVVKAVAAGVAAGFDVTYVNATDACGATLTGCVDGCGGGHPGESGHRGLYYRRPTHHHFINPLTPYRRQLDPHALTLTHSAMALRALPLIAAKLGLPYNPF